jgi:hypothetical protein
MTGDELKACLDRIGISINRVEIQMGFPENTIRRLVHGQKPVPDELARWARTVSAVVEALGVPDLDQ